MLIDLCFFWGKIFPNEFISNDISNEKKTKNHRYVICEPIRSETLKNIDNKSCTVSGNISFIPFFLLEIFEKDRKRNFVL